MDGTQPKTKVNTESLIAYLPQVILTGEGRNTDCRLLMTEATLR